MGIGSTLWNIVKETASKATVAYGAYEIGKSNNEAAKFSNTVVQMQNEINTKLDENNNSNLVQYCIIGLVLVIIFGIIIQFLRFYKKRVLTKDRRIRTTKPRNNIAEAEC